jgi:PilZ domain
MATNFQPSPTNNLPLIASTNAKSEADRRTEPRFGAEGEVTVLMSEASGESEIKAKLLDFSLHGLRIRMSRQLSAGQQVRVFFSWGEICTNVKWSTPVAGGFDIGLQLF